MGAATWKFWCRGERTWPVEHWVEGAEIPDDWFVCASQWAAEHAAEVLNALEAEVERLKGEPIGAKGD